MMRYLWLGLGMLLAGAGLLTVLRAPTLWLWMTAVLVGEFGHFLVALPLMVGVLGWCQGGELRWATAGLCTIAVILLLRPAVQAARIGRTLPAQLEHAFGPALVSHAPFAWTGLLKRPDLPVTVETRVFAPADAAAGRSAPLALDFYRAAGRTTPAPCVIVIHGGGWDNGERGQLPALNHHLARLGYAVAAVTYRLAPQTIWPAQGDDIAAAIAYLKAHATDLGLDPTRLVLLGRSAGGQLAGAVGYGRPDPAVRGVISLYGPHDQVFAWQFSREDDLLNAVKLLRQYLGGTPETAAEAYRTSSGYLIVTAQNAVPTLLVHGLQDSLVWHKQSERLQARLDGLNTPNAFVSLPWATHACDFNPRGPSGQLTWYAVEWFLAAVTK